MIFFKKVSKFQIQNFKIKKKIEFEIEFKNLNLNLKNFKKKKSICQKIISLSQY
jgi:hypothetical protein